MEKLSILAVLAVVGLGIVGCSRYDKELSDEALDEVRGFYETPHQLRKMLVKEEEITVREPGRGSISGGFFLFIGGMSGEYKEGTTTKYHVTHVTFAWEIKDNTYIMTTLPLEKIRIKLVEKLDTPTASFFLDEFAVKQRFSGLTNRLDSYEWSKKIFEYNIGRVLKNYYNPHEALAQYLAYATFAVRSDDWPSNINLPVNQGYRK